MAAVTLTKLTKDFPGGVSAVKEISLGIEDQEFLVLVGPSGCGKSTTLRMIAGLETCTSGDIHIGGIRINDLPPKDRDIAMVFQNYALYPHKTVYKNLAFALELRGMPKTEIKRRVYEAGEILDITQLFTRKPKALSGGQRQRVAVGRAIVRQPKVFLFDEPLSNLDAKLRVQMRAELSKLHQRLRATMIYVTHDQVEAMTMGSRIVVMNEGEIQQAAPPLEVYRRPANLFVAGFIGSPPMNFIEGKLARAAEAWRFRDARGAVDLKLPASRAEMAAANTEKPVTLGIRPEHLRVGGPETAPGRTLRVRLELAEPLGAEILLRLDCGGHALTAGVHAETAPAAGTELDMEVDMDKVHFFDSATGQMLF